VWWFEKVVTPQLDVYTVKSFVVDSINELILAAMGADCWVGETNFGKVGDTSKSSISPPRVSFTSFSAPLGKGQKDRIPNKGRIGVDNDGIIQYNSNRKEGVDWSLPDNHVEYVFIYCSAWAKKSAQEILKKTTAMAYITCQSEATPVQLKRLILKKTKICQIFKQEKRCLRSKGSTSWCLFIMPR